MTDIFKKAKFGDRFTCFEDGGEYDCVFLERMDVGDSCPPRYKLARNIDVKYEDGGEKSFSAEIIADKDGKVYEGCAVGLSRTFIVASLVQLVPNYSVMKRIPRDVGYYQGGMDDHWRWESPHSIMVNKKRSTEELYELYLMCRENCDDDLADIKGTEDTSENEVEVEEDMNEVGIKDKELLSLIENSVHFNLEHNFFKNF